MKVLFAFTLIVCISVAMVYYRGGFSGFDATKQGETARAAVTPGMSWQKVFQVVKEPRKYQAIYRKVKTIGGVEVEYFEMGPPNKFNRTSFDTRMVDNGLPHGFRVVYRYSELVAFAVTFDGAGNVAGVEDVATMADFLQLRD